MQATRRCARRIAEKRFSTRAMEDRERNVKAFEEIPGPKSLPLVGTLYKYLPLIGEYDMKRIHVNGQLKYAKYGAIVREEIVPGEPLVWIYRPEDIAEVFKADVGRYPERRSHRALYKFRTDRRQIYNTGGLIPTNGEDWWRQRKEFQKALSKTQNLINYIPDLDVAISRFVRFCENNHFEDWADPISRLFFELICLVAFDLKINAFTPEEMKADSLSSQLINAAFTSNYVTLRLDNGPRLWHYFDTPLYRKFCKSQACIEKVALKLVSEKAEKVKNSEPKETQSLLEIYLRNEALDLKDVVGVSCDMILAGVDTITYSAAFALYHLARDRRAQEKLNEEAEKIVMNDAVTADTLKNAFYTKAVIKETFRLNPISVGVGRILQSDIVLSGYQIPKGTNVVTQNQISCRLPQYFEEPDKFIPERWLRDSEKNEIASIHPYLLLPFGHGPRSCIARRLAEQQLQMTLLRICQRLKFTWEGGELDCESYLVNKPDGPIKLKFQKR